ncbi:bifunctional biotin--[acetyl-CoA-carboxylase] ligase/biotin operon repressor BirA [Pseudoalteromonas piscicida]|uniref:Bifunctional ligase/repressor BirA n=1 Tax=Pseudoalteromonas piscicida TaxID=43662 RepID=A0AAD0RLJ4_PSEO7|nr:bifunctional biotin--[acetyl-CoA-carboxylase] ligase/biotin operon repressor BirA [Pseudoalteromonas piscicida]ASD65768.1 biotin--[acetyl-CoA-carboxylase] ligase [Pseudoalteromonas piscicida]AXQ96522.1 bifunctional biotin--[acetyl-CoA-carboxylase] ligase/biotin operon repressor BirA [Pseudoalteromonas piscicida]AXR00803.1 bifunctional biotin--[acetyl-CoA-carboxylase] ligase/biotin operon repressor BirA [Pseudoalteromonas piscicida]
MKTPDHKKQTILAALNKGEFVSGQELGAQLGISRAAIAKHIAALQEMGVDIFRVNGRGYKLNYSLPLIHQSKLNTLWQQQFQSECPIEYHAIIDSTNSELMRRLQDKQNMDSGHVLVAEMQQAGRGRRGRVWQSPFGANLYYSYYWQFDAGMQAAMGLSIAVGLAVYDALKVLYGISIELKWPNDIYLNQQKLAGILVELEGQVEGPCHLVIGIGLNICMPESASKHIDQAWTDLQTHLGQIDKNQLVVQLTHSLSERLAQYKESGLSEMVTEWNSLNVFKGDAVTLSTGQREWRGICEGIDMQGGLLLRQDGELRAFYGGEISLRKVIS